MKIIDIGAGTRPIPNCDVYTDLYEKANAHRDSVQGDLPKVDYFGKQSIDGKWVICDVENMPMFQDKEFDFAYCRSVLEHSENPAAACDELMRIARGGYITTPSPFGENEYHRDRVEHLWYVWTDDGITLNFWQKSKGFPSPAPPNQFSRDLMEFFWKDKFFYAITTNSGYHTNKE